MAKMSAILARSPPTQMVAYISTRVNSILPDSSFWELLVGSLKLTLELTILMTARGSQVREDIDSDDLFGDVITVGDDKPEMNIQL